MNLTNPTMVCSYRSSYIELHVALVECQVEGFPSRSYHVCQEEYVLLNYVDFGGAERNVCRNCVENIRVRGKSETLKKLGYRTL